MEGGSICAVTLGSPARPLRQQLRNDIRECGFGLNVFSGSNDLGV